MQTTAAENAAQTPSAPPASSTPARQAQKPYAVRAVKTRPARGPGGEPVEPVLLAVDTSSHCIGLALYDGVQVVHESAWISHDYHTVELAPAVAEALERASLTPENLSALAVALGPGSFTGLRIGLALVKGLAIARSLPVLGIPTLDALAVAQPVSNDLRLAAVLRAGRGRLAVGWYQAAEGRWRAAAPVEVLTAEELALKIEEPALVCGELSAEERSVLHHQQPLARLASPAQSLRRPGFLAELAWQRWKTGQSDDPASLAPIYLHYNNRGLETGPSSGPAAPAGGEPG